MIKPRISFTVKNTRTSTVKNTGNLPLALKPFFTYGYRVMGTMSLKILFAFVLSIVSFSFLPVPHAFASTGYISLPTTILNGNTPFWSPGQYTVSPYLDPFHYSDCATDSQYYLSGALYNSTDNSLVQSGLRRGGGCDGYMTFSTLNAGVFQYDTPYYFVITDPQTGQTWQSPCFVDQSSTGRVVGCAGNNSPILQTLSNAHVSVGGTYTATGSLTDPDSTSWTATVDYGDGSGVQPLTLSGTNFSLSHQYNTAQGTYKVAVSVTDDQGATAGVSSLISVTGSGTISIPNALIGNRSDILWQPSQYTATPSIDPFHYRSCANDGQYYLSGALYNSSDNSLVQSGLVRGGGCDGYMGFDRLNTGAFQNNTPYYFIITDPLTGQTWQSACFEDTGNDNQLVGCNQAPVVNPFSGASINEGATYSTTGSFTDADSTSWTGRVDYGDGTGEHDFAAPDETIDQTNHTLTLHHVYKDNQTNDAPYTVKVTIKDNQGATSDPATAQVTVHNGAPTPGAITVNNSVVQVNNSVAASASFTDPGVLDTHTARLDWGDGNTTTCPPNSSACTLTESNGSGTVTGSHTYTATGVYTITLTVTDKDSGQGTSTYSYVAAYDTNTSFAGGTSFDNPASASPNTTGKVKFGISAKYNNNNVLTGNVKMNFKAANLDFVSTSLQSLATTNGRAYLKGTGTLNGSGGYTFLATGIDGSITGGSDLIRFQIKDSSGDVVYDSQPGASDTTDPTTPVATGNIRIQ